MLKWKKYTYNVFAIITYSFLMTHNSPGEFKPLSTV